MKSIFFYITTLCTAVKMGSDEMVQLLLTSKTIDINLPSILYYLF